jgi:hypothetical protein
MLGRGTSDDGRETQPIRVFVARRLREVEAELARPKID